MVSKSLALVSSKSLRWSFAPSQAFWDLCANKTGESDKIHLWQKYLSAIAVIITLTVHFWSVQYILTDQSGDIAQILSQRNCGNPTIPIVTIPPWKQNVAGIRSLQVNAQNVALYFRECGYHQSNGVVSAVAGKTSCNQNLRSKFWLFFAIATIHITTFDIINRIQHRRRGCHNISLFTTEI